MSESKADLRRRILLQLKALDPHQRSARSERLCEAIRALPLWQKARRVALFYPMATEPEITPLWESAKAFAYPRIEGESLRFFHVESPSALLASRWNLMEPPPAPEAEWSLHEIDLLLVPGVAFTLRGERMGHGRGYYDRALALPGPRPVTLGICFKEQLVPTLPLEPHDRPVDHLAVAH